MINVIKKSLLQLIDDIDVGNTNISEEEEIEVLKLLQKLRKDEGMSKYSAYTYLNISRATFDNYVAEGMIPKGQKVIGFKELRWFKKDLDNFIKQCKDENEKEI
jgi:predicted DNA-binding transcriptional regulator AlpA